MQTNEELTPEETAAMEAMESDTSVELEEPKEPVQEEQQPEPKEPEETKEAEPEFKTTREKPPEGFVPHQAMHAERMKRQELEGQLAELTKWKEQQEAAAVQAQEPQWADPLVDPEGFKRYQDHQQSKLNDQIQAQNKQFADQQALNARVASAQRFEAEFKTTTPDYDDAARFIQEKRVNDLRAAGHGDQAIVQQIAQDANAIFEAGERLGMNPAQLLYMRAQAEGYTKAPDPAAQAAQTAEAEAAKITALAEAQKETQGLGTTGGKQGGQITAAQLAEMSEAELAKVSDDDIRRAMGG